MNIERLQILADTIRHQPHVPRNAAAGFNMRQYHHRCGTPSCIGGWASHLWPGHLGQWTYVKAAAALDMDEEWLIDNLFEPELPIQYDDVTPAMAAQAIERIIAAGKEYVHMTVAQVWGLE